MNVRLIESETRRPVLLRAAYAAQRELERRARHHPSGPSLERWLRFAIRHEDLVGWACAADARSLLVDRYGVHVWDALVEVGVREDIAHRYRHTIASLLERQRGRVENPWSTREIRRAAFDVAFRYAYVEEGQEST